MGREVRRVPPNWKHPVLLDRGNGNKFLQPMHDKTFQDAAAEWKSNFAKWEAGDRPDYCTDSSRSLEYWEYEDAPPSDRAYYRPWKGEEATWYQLWETVSEGTPVTPPFETKEALIDHLVTHGTDYDHRPWSLDQAKAMVDIGWSPSAIFAGGKFYDSEHAAMIAKDMKS